MRLYKTSEESLQRSRRALVYVREWLAAACGRRGSARAVLAGMCMLYCSALIMVAADHAEGRHVLHIDERLIFDQVDAILNAPSAAQRFYAIKDNGDHRYGRILYNALALVSWAPRRIWGETGQIIASRVASSAILVSAYVVLAGAVGLAGWWHTGVVFILLCLPSTPYYALMPKPEPLQILALAGFLAVVRRRDEWWGGHWLLMGLAFGAKISTLPAMLVAGLWARLTLSGRPTSLWMRATVTSLVAFVAGWCHAVPALVFGDRSLWWPPTFGNTTHGADDAQAHLLQFGLAEWPLKDTYDGTGPVCQHMRKG